MNSKSKEEIRDAVRKTYTNIARGSGAITEKNPTASCCDTVGISSGVGEALSCCGPSKMSAEESAGESCGCVPPGVTTEHISVIMGYSKDDLKSTPAGANTRIDINKFMSCIFHI